MDNDALNPLDVPWYRTPFFERLILLACPPLGWWLVYRDPTCPRGRKVLVTLFTLLWLVVYLALLLALAVLLRWVDLEFKGGWGPTLVRERSRPNYELVEVSRRAQAELPAPTNQPPAPPAYWTDFRGPGRAAHYDEQPVLTDWPPAGPPRLWRQPCGGGYASFVVAEGLAFTLEQRWEHEVIAAYELDTGREVWTHRYEALFSEWMGGDGPRATPVYHGGLVFSLGATGELRCLSARSGTLLWRKNILTETGAQNLRWGLAASPVIVGETLLVVGGEGTSEQMLVAFDQVSGRRLWAALSDKPTYASPLYAELAGRPQLVLVTASRVLGFDPASRAVLWEEPWKVAYDASCSVPVLVASNRVFVAAGYGTGGVLLEVTAEAGRPRAQVLWRSRHLKTKFNPAVYWQDHLYGLDEGVLACVDARTGERVWREGRYGYGQVLLAAGHLLVLGGEGQLALVEATPAGFREKARVQALNGKTWNVPALAHGRLLLRNATEMTCFDLRLRPAAPATP
jgi:outer membrane protein assembly factor BamB